MKFLFVTGGLKLAKKQVLRKSEILIRIDCLRDKLHFLINEFGIESKEVLKCSIELDELIFYLNEQENRKKPSNGTH